MSTRQTPSVDLHAGAADAQSPAAEQAFIAEALRAEADAVIRIADAVGGDAAGQWSDALDLLQKCKGHVVVSGMGKSGLIGAKISATFSSLGQPSSVVHPSEAVHGDLGRFRRNDVALLLSFSGETEEAVTLAAILKADGVPRLSITSNPESRLARMSDVHVSIGAITEACPHNLAPTASTTATVAIGDALALALARRRNFDADDFQKTHPGGMLGAQLRPITDVLRFKVGKNLPVIPAATSVEDALRTAHEGRRAGAVLIVDDDGRLAGIFTDGDFRRLMLSESPASLTKPIGEVMTRAPKHLTTNHLVRDAVALMTERRLDEIPVVNERGEPVGLVDVQDLIAIKVLRES